MARKHFDTLWIDGALFCVSVPSQTPTAHDCATFRVSLLYPALDRPHMLGVWLWTGFGNGEKHAGDATPSSDPREAVPTSDPKRSGRATRDGWQLTAILNTDAMTADFVTRSVDDNRFVSHVAAGMSGSGYTLSGFSYVVTLFDAIERPTTLSRTGVPLSAQFRNTEANTATKRSAAGGGFMARDGGRNPLMDWRQSPPPMGLD